MDFPEILKHPQGPYGQQPYFIPAQLFDLRDLCDLAEKHGLDVLGKGLHDLTEYFREVTGYMWSNPYHFIQHHSHMYKFLVISGTCQIWDMFDFTICATDFSKANYFTLENYLNKYEQGQIQCSQCHTWMSLKENSSHRYFAGIYCETCWEGGMKQVEAAETYD